jgi:cell wall-associated NlpC family hydrolase
MKTLFQKKVHALLVACLVLVLVQPSFAKRKKRVRNSSAVSANSRDSVYVKAVPFDLETVAGKDIDRVIDFAKAQLGTPYKYASSDPKNGGLDCSGFVFYVFQHFRVTVPRSSKDYMQFGKSINARDARKGDVIVFTGSNAKQKTGGHVGIVLDAKKDDITFIHGSSGKSQGVIISKLSEAYYSERFLRVVRVLN